MSNTNNNLQTQTSNALHNAIMEVGGKDRPPMLAPGNYVQWKSRIKIYIDTKPNNELIHYCLQNPPYKFKWTEKTVLVVEGSSETTTQGYMENYKNVSQDIKNQLDAKAENEVNEIRAERLAHTDNLLALVAQQQPVYHPQNHHNHYTQTSSTRSQQAPTRYRGKEIVNSPLPTCDQEPTMVVKDDEMSKQKEIDKLMALISLSFKKIYKPTNNNLRFSSNTSRGNQDNFPRINRGIRYDNQKTINVAGARENVGKGCTLSKGEDVIELEAHYMYMTQIQEVTPYAADNSRPIFDVEPLQKEQGDTNITIDSLDMSTNRETVDQYDDDLARERDLLASLIDKLKCEIDDNKNRNKFLESSNKALVDKLKGEIKDFKTKNKSLESSNNHFKEANNELSKTN
nr:hypothetical protein [Tanacetum cinerariifolium]